MCGRPTWVVPVVFVVGGELGGGGGGGGEVEGKASERAEGVVREAPHAVHALFEGVTVPRLLPRPRAERERARGAVAQPHIRDERLVAPGYRYRYTRYRYRYRYKSRGVLLLRSTVVLAYM